MGKVTRTGKCKKVAFSTRIFSGNNCAKINTPCFDKKVVCLIENVLSCASLVLFLIIDANSLLYFYSSKIKLSFYSNTLTLIDKQFNITPFYLLLQLKSHFILKCEICPFRIVSSINTVILLNRPLQLI